MGFNALLADLTSAVDEHLGDPATWIVGATGSNEPVRVHLIVDDETQRFGEGAVLMASRAVQIHQRWGIKPEAYEYFIMDENNETFRCHGDATLDAEGFWTIAISPGP